VIQAAGDPLRDDRVLRGRGVADPADRERDGHLLLGVHAADGVPGQDVAVTLRDREVLGVEVVGNRAGVFLRGVQVPLGGGGRLDDPAVSVMVRGRAELAFGTFLASSFAALPIAARTRAPCF
jgi:hypothetical protein